MRSAVRSSWRSCALDRARYRSGRTSRQGGRSPAAFGGAQGRGQARRRLSSNRGRERRAGRRHARASRRYHPGRRADAGQHGLHRRRSGADGRALSSREASRRSHGNNRRRSHRTHCFAVPSPRPARRSRWSSAPAARPCSAPQHPRWQRLRRHRPSSAICIEFGLLIARLTLALVVVVLATRVLFGRSSARIR